MKLRSRNISDVLEVEEQEVMDQDRRQSKRLRNAPAHFHDDFDKLYSPKKGQQQLEEQPKVAVLPKIDERPQNLRRSLRIAQKNNQEEEQVPKVVRKAKVEKARVNVLPVRKRKPAPRRRRAPVARRRRGRIAFGRPNPFHFDMRNDFRIEAAPEDFIKVLQEEDLLKIKYKLYWPSANPNSWSSGKEEEKENNNINAEQTSSDLLSEEEKQKNQAMEDIKKKLEEVEKSKTFEPISLEKISLNKAHVKFPVAQFHEELPLADITSFHLNDILQNCDIPKEESEKWKSYGGYDLFSDKDAISRSLNTVINYAENDNNTSQGLRNKLRLVTKILQEDKNAQPGILCMLASNGNLCNVQKEIGINMAYSLLTENLKEDLEKQSLKNIVLRQLQVLRELVVEEMFIASGNYVNSHPLVGYRNGLAPHLGLHHIPDQHTSTNVADKNRLYDFFLRYNPERLVKFLAVSINENPKKISYEKVVDWFKENSPLEDSYEFLSEVFDENGLLTQQAILYMLYRFNIFQ